MSDENDSAGKGESELLEHDLSFRKDMRLIETAIKKRWKIPDSLREKLIERLSGIIDKTEVGVATKVGIMTLEGPADINAIQAARVLVAIEAQNQSDEQFAEKTDKGGGDTVVNIGSIHMGQEPLTIDDAKSQAEAVLERFRANKRVIEVKAETSAPGTDLGSL